jgi:hypothetical protein
LAGSAGALPATAVCPANGAGAGTAAAGFLWAAGLAAWCAAAKDAEPGTRAPAAIATTSEGRRKPLVCMAFMGQNGNCRGSGVVFFGVVHEASHTKCPQPLIFGIHANGIAWAANPAARI